MNLLMEESESPNKVIDHDSRCQSSATEYVPKPKALQKEEKLMIMITTFWLKLSLNKVGFKNTFCPICKIIFMIRLLMEQDIPTNYEEVMIDLSTRND